LLKLKVVTVSAFVLAALTFAVSTNTQTKVETAGQKFKSIQVLNDMPADQMGKVMNMISASLGVDCKFCHASNDGGYEKEGFEHKDTARKMMRMTFDINKQNFDGRPEINCNTCHNGRSHPQPSFPLGVAKGAEPRPAEPAVKPIAADVISKFETAIGGRAAIDKIASRQIRSLRVEPDGKTTEPETIWTSKGKYAAELVYGDYRLREIFDGSGGRKFGNTERIELRPDEAEQIKRDAELLNGVDLRKVYNRIDYRFIDRIEGREVYMLQATTPGNIRERLYFDVSSGYLVRRTVSTPTVMGNFVYQVDYSDYKDFGGVKLPATVHYSVPHIAWTRKILEVKNNVPVSDAVFAAPGK
jgi:photosynthetic reaction center cytochrome c subunit